MGVDSYRSSALPLGMSPTWGISTKTTSPSSWAAAQWAAVAPTLPAPTMVIFGRLIRLCSLHGSLLLSLTSLVGGVILAMYENCGQRAVLRAEWSASMNRDASPRESRCAPLR